MSEKDGGSAFPESQTQFGGMTLRDYFAGQVLASVSIGWFEDPGARSELARRAYATADAMLEARKK